MENLTSRPLSEGDKQAIADWHYPGEYGVYDLPPYEEQLRTGTCLCNPLRRENFLGWWDGETLVGFTNLLEEETMVFLGIGAAPALCGQGYGTRMALQAAALAKDRWPEKPVYLEVRTWNRRAIRCYEKAGFQISGEAFTQRTLAGEGDFYRMVRN